LVQAAAKQYRPAPAPTELPADTTLRKVTSAGTFTLAGVTYIVGGPYGFQQVLVITDCDKITVADLNGEILIEHTRPHQAGNTSGTVDPADPAPKPP
jgi:hypothetical protein